MKNKILFLLIFTLLSCKRESKFNLEKDLYQFTEKMENGDTVEISADLSACMYTGKEKYTFTKQSDSLFIETFSEAGSFEKKSQILPKMFYPIKAKDSLSFENYFDYLKKNEVPVRQRPLITIFYKNKYQSYIFSDSDLSDKFNKLGNLNLIRKKLYPKDDFFKVEEPPPPPPPEK